MVEFNSQLRQDSFLPLYTAVNNLPELGNSPLIPCFKLFKQSKCFCFQFLVGFQLSINPDVFVQQVIELWLFSLAGYYEQGNLLANVINKIMHISVIAMKPKQPGKRIADKAVSCPSNMGACIRVNAGMLNNGFLAFQLQRAIF